MGAVIAITHIFDCTWSSSTSRDLIAIKCWSRQALTTEVLMNWPWHIKIQWRMTQTQINSRRSTGTWMEVSKNASVQKRDALFKYKVYHYLVLPVGVSTSPWLAMCIDIILAAVACRLDCNVRSLCGIVFSMTRAVPPWKVPLVSINRQQKSTINKYRQLSKVHSYRSTWWSRSFKTFSICDRQVFEGQHWHTRWPKEIERWPVADQNKQSIIQQQTPWTLWSCRSSSESHTSPNSQLIKRSYQMLRIKARFWRWNHYWASSPRSRWQLQHQS